MDPVSKRPEKLGLAGVALSLALLLVTLGVGVFWAHSRIIEAACLPLLVAFVFGWAAWWYGRLRRHEAQEEEDQEQLRRDYGRNDLFDEADESLKLSHESRRQFQKYFIPGFTLVMGIVVVLAALAVWSRWDAVQDPNFGRTPLDVAGLSFCMTFICLLAGSYFSGLSREKYCHFLRPVAGWLLLTTALYAIAMAAMLLEHFHVENWDVTVGKIVIVLIGVFGIEMIGNFVIEFFRPRGEKDAIRPVYESRVLILFTEPGSIAQKVADLIEYQTGVKVSEEWFFQFLRQAALPCVILLVAAFLLLDCFVLVGAHELAVNERFGKPRDGVLEPGLHLKWPRPIDRVRKESVKSIKKIEIGFSEEGGDAHSAPAGPGDAGAKKTDPAKLIVWDREHHANEQKFVVGDSDPQVPYNFMAASIPIYYQIKDTPEGLREYLYNYDDPDTLLQKIASCEIVKYLISADLIDLLAVKRIQAKSDLEKRISDALTDVNPPLGIELLFVGLSGVHPPTEVGPAFQEVIKATEQSNTRVLQARQFEAQSKAQVIGETYKITTEATTEKTRRIARATGTVLRFKEQLKVFQRSPSTYELRYKLGVLRDRSSGMTKFLIETKSKKVYIFDATSAERPRLDQYDQADEAAEKAKAAAGDGHGH
jgi:membrane protease subunit HflK